MCFVASTERAAVGVRYLYDIDLIIDRVASLGGPANAVADGIHSVYQSTFEAYWEANSEAAYDSIEWTVAEERYTRRDTIVATQHQAVGHLPYKIRNKIEETTVRLSQTDFRRPDGPLWSDLPSDVPDGQSELLQAPFAPDERMYLGEQVIRFLRSMFEELSIQTMLKHVYSRRLPHEKEQTKPALTERLTQAGASTMEVKLGVAESTPHSAGSDGLKILERTQSTASDLSLTQYQTSYGLAEAMCSLAYHHLATEFDP